MNKNTIIILFTVFLIAASLGCAESNSQEPVSVQAQPTPAHVDPPTQEDIFDYCEWNYYVTPSIGEYNIAPAGYNYYVVTAHIRNTGTQTYSTNPWSWTLEAEGIIYTHDDATYDESINSHTVQVGPGGDIEVQFVYLVKGEPDEVTLYYNW